MTLLPISLKKTPHGSMAPDEPVCVCVHRVQSHRSTATTTGATVLSGRLLILDFCKNWNSCSGFYSWFLLEDDVAAKIERNFIGVWPRYTVQHATCLHNIPTRWLTRIIFDIHRTIHELDTPNKFGQVQSTRKVCNTLNFITLTIVCVFTFGYRQTVFNKQIG